MHDSREKEQFFDAWLALTRGTAPSSGTVELPALTGSMLPDIPCGTVLTIQACTSKDCAMGDVVVYREEEVKLVAHRLLLRVGWRPWQWLFQKGDNNPTGCWIRSSAIVGVVTGIQPPVESGDLAGQQRQQLASRCQAWRSLMGHTGHQLLAGPRALRKWIKRIFLGPAHNLDGDQS